MNNAIMMSALLAGSKGTVDANYVTGAIPMSLVKPNGSPIFSSDGIYGQDEINIGGTIQDMTMAIGSSYGLKYESPANTTMVIFNKNPYNELWEDEIGVDFFDQELAVNIGDGNYAKVMDLPHGGFIFLKRESSTGYGIYTYASYDSSPVLIHSFNAPSADYIYPWFAFWEGDSCVPFPQMFVDNPPIPDPPGTLTVGSGSGEIYLDASLVDYSSYNTLRIREGSYSNIIIVNFDRSSNPITINNKGLVESDMFVLANLKGVNIIGNGVEGLKYGFELHNIGYRAVILEGILHDLTISNFSFANISDYCIFYGDKVPYVNTKATRTDNLKINNNKFVGVGTITLQGYLGSDGDTGLITNLEFAYNDISDSGWGSILYAENAANYNIHHNTVDGYAQTLAEHNGIFWMKGNGKLHNNKVTNYSGNILRAWAFNRLEFPSKMELYNNIGYNSWRYGLFELQGFTSLLVAGKTEMSNAEVYNNTGGLLDTSMNWEGTIVDIYDNLGTITVDNNLGFQMHKAGGGTVTDSTMINHVAGGTYTQSGNRYFANQVDAVEDTINFKSKIVGVGAGEI